MKEETNSPVEHRKKLVGSRRTKLVDGRVVDGAHKPARRLLGHSLEHLVEVRGTQLVHKRHGALNKEDVGEVHAHHDVVARGAVVHTVVVRHSLLGDGVGNAVAPVGVVAARTPLTQIHSIALHNARTPGRHSQKGACTVSRTRNCISQKHQTQKVTKQRRMRKWLRNKRRTIGMLPWSSMTPKSCDWQEKKKMRKKDK